MAILFRCDVCNKETKVFWNISIARKKCFGNNPPSVEKAMAFDVCSTKCEEQAVLTILSEIVPTFHVIDPSTDTNEKTNV